MESLERKDETVGTEEPIKSEGIVPSPNTSERSNGSSSPPPHCSICLGKLVNTSFTDSCLHQFCFTCLLQWSKIKTECPLCKQTFKSIIHNVRSEGDYDQYHVHYSSQVAATLDVAAGDIHISGQWDVAVHNVAAVHPIGLFQTNRTAPFMYRTTMGHNNRRFPAGLMLNADAVARQEQIPSIAHQNSIQERRRRATNPLDYRRTVYRHGVWSASLPDAFGRYRESSAEYYRRNPSEMGRLISWLNRELQVLLNNNQPHIAYVMSVITEAIVRCDIDTSEFRNIVRPYFQVHTEHFVHEFSNFARTNFDVPGYDQAVTYFTNRGLSNEYDMRVVSPTPSTSSSSSDDSDVRVLDDDAFDPRRLGHPMVPSVGPHIIDMPGPSTVGQAFRLQLFNPISQREPDILTISSTSSSSDDDCEVVGFVKPRHERTPEIINLSSSGEEEEIEVNSPTSTQLTTIDIVQSEVTIPLKDESMPSTSSSVDNTNRRTRRSAEAVNSQIFINEYLNSTSEIDSDESDDSDYNPSSKSRRHKSSKKSKSSSRLKRSRKSRKKQKATKTKCEEEPRARSLSYSSHNHESENEGSQRTTSTTRGTKRYPSKSPDCTDSEKLTKKSKKSKKSKSSKKSKKQRSIKTRKYSSYSDSSTSDSDSEDESVKKPVRRRTRKSSNPRRYTSDEEHRYNSNESNQDSSPDRLRIVENEDCDNDDVDDDDAGEFSEASHHEGEHSAAKVAKRHRSHKKRNKESKKRRRSRS